MSGALSSLLMFHGLCGCTFQTLRELSQETKTNPTPSRLTHNMGRKRSSRLHLQLWARSVDHLVKRHQSEKNLWSAAKASWFGKRWSKTSVQRSRERLGRNPQSRALHRVGWTVPHHESPMWVCGWRRSRLLHSWRASAALAHLSTSYSSL